ncbi:TetR/AcrR family transcriptional regulator [Rhizorhabdus sp. FW153]|uniref:TetR/AcrR family transcriptional regulator n=1 Tax=Rhizorhabdus sp. FW153 TaxID=3400216 RepID=UPI003CF1FE1D
MRSGRQQGQVVASRQDVVEAMRGLLRSRPFDEIPVEDILAASGVSRATFYRHFKSRRDVALSIYEATLERAMPHFLRLAEVATGGLSARWWAHQAVGFYREEGQISVLIHGLAATDQAFHQRARDDRQRLIERLAPEVRAFGRAIGDTAEARRQRARADIFFMLLDRISAEVTLFAELADVEDYEAVLAEQVAAFVIDN